MSQFDDNQILPVAALFVSAASMAASWGNYLRDRGRLDVDIGIWKEADIYPLTPCPFYLRIQAVNSGRRPLVLKSLSALSFGQRLRRSINSILPYRLRLSTSSTLIFWPELDKKFRSAEGGPVIYSEGQGFETYLPIIGMRGQNIDFWARVKDIYISDSIRRSHFAPRAIVEKFKNDLANLDSSLISRV